MRQTKEINPNRVFKGAFRAGLIIIICLSTLISWIALNIVRSFEKNPKEKDKIEEISIEREKDTVFIEKIINTRTVDTVYRYLSPPKMQSGNPISQKEDTFPK